MSTVQSYNYIELRKFDTFDFLTIIHLIFFKIDLIRKDRSLFLRSKNIHGCFFQGVTKFPNMQGEMSR